MTPPMKDVNIMIVGLCEIAEGIITVCSFGTFHPDFISKYIQWRRR